MSSLCPRICHHNQRPFADSRIFHGCHLRGAVPDVGGSHRGSERHDRDEQQRNQPQAHGSGPSRNVSADDELKLLQFTTSAVVVLSRAIDRLTSAGKVTATLLRGSLHCRSWGLAPLFPPRMTANTICCDVIFSCGYR